MKQEIKQRVNDLMGGRSIREFAKQNGLTYSGLYKIMTGEVKPSFDTLVALCTATGASPRWLLLDEGEMMERGGNSGEVIYSPINGEALLEALRLARRQAMELQGRFEPGTEDAHGRLVVLNYERLMEEHEAAGETERDAKTG